MPPIRANPAPIICAKTAALTPAMAYVMTSIYRLFRTGGAFVDIRFRYGTIVLL